MDRQIVSSSNLNSIGYDEVNKVLEIEFNSGGIYQYMSVPQDTYKNLLSADSHGKFFHSNIRNAFPYKKIF